jgi:4-amino-4-deoxy-L-arabinose transferase-like glycosyltransferase
MWRSLHLMAFAAFGGKPMVGAARWDDGYYLTILHQGYRPFPGYGVWQQTNFFPLLPWITRCTQFVVRSQTVAIHSVVTAAQLAAVLLLYTFAKQLFDERTALLSVVLLLLAPGDRARHRDARPVPPGR